MILIKGQLYEEKRRKRPGIMRWNWLPRESISMRKILISHLQFVVIRQRLWWLHSEIGELCSFICFKSEFFAALVVFYWFFTSRRTRLHLSLSLSLFRSFPLSACALFVYAVCLNMFHLSCAAHFYQHLQVHPWLLIFLRSSPPFRVCVCVCVEHCRLLTASDFPSFVHIQLKFWLACAVAALLLRALGLCVIFTLNASAFHCTDTHPHFTRITYNGFLCTHKKKSHAFHAYSSSASHLLDTMCMHMRATRIA